MFFSIYINSISFDRLQFRARDSWGIIIECVSFDFDNSCTRKWLHSSNCSDLSMKSSFSLVTSADVKFDGTNLDVESINDRKQENIDAN